MTRRGKKRWKILDRVVFGKTDDPYLDRLRVIQTPWASIYVHKILRADQERHIHDHPWPFASFILRGGYTELYVHDAEATQTPRNASLDARFTHSWLRQECRTWRRWSFHRLGTRSAHRIIHVEPGTMTLVFVGKPLDREWGFWTEEGHIPWSEYKDRWDVLQGTNV